MTDATDGKGAAIRGERGASGRCFVILMRRNDLTRMQDAAGLWATASRYMVF